MSCFIQKKGYDGPIILSLVQVGTFSHSQLSSGGSGGGTEKILWAAKTQKRLGGGEGVDILPYPCKIVTKVYYISLAIILPIFTIAIRKTLFNNVVPL